MTAAALAPCSRTSTSTRRTRGWWPSAASHSFNDPLDQSGEGFAAGARHETDLRNAARSRFFEPGSLGVVFGHKGHVIEAALQGYLDRLQRAEVDHPAAFVEPFSFEHKLHREGVAMQQAAVRVGLPLAERDGQAEVVSVGLGCAVLHQ